MEPSRAVRWYWTIPLRFAHHNHTGYDDWLRNRQSTMCFMVVANKVEQGSWLCYTVASTYPKCVLHLTKWDMIG